MAHRKQIPTSLVLAGVGAILIASMIMAIVYCVPATFFLMLFLGNVGLGEVGFLGALPGGLLIGTLASRVTVNKD